MTTAADTYQLNQELGAASVPGYDSPQGNPIALASLKPLSSMSTNPGSGIFYNPYDQCVEINQAGAVLSGYDLRGTKVEVNANNVTISDCTFDDKDLWFTVTQNVGSSGMIVKNCTFDGGDNISLSAFVESPTGVATVIDNSFINTPSHAVDISAGVVADNYFSGAGFIPGTHADAISVLGTTGPVLITGNYIDWTPSPGAVVTTNNAIRITIEGGNVSDVTVDNNIILGGQYSVDVGYGDASPSNGVFTNVVVTNNYIGDFVYGAYYPQDPPGVTMGSYVDVGFDNPALSAAAWTAYQAKGISTNSLIEASASYSGVSATATGSTTLYGDNVAGAHLWGSNSLTIFVGGAGTQYFYSGAGKNIFSYLAVADSTSIGADYLEDFNVSSDVIDLHALNAEPGSATPVNFTFIGNAAFSRAGGQVSYVQNAATNTTLVEADLVGDSSADLSIRLNGLLTLTAANFALTSAQYAADVAPYTTIATFLASETPSTSPVSANAPPSARARARVSASSSLGAISIVDSVANIQPNIAALEADASNINAVTATNGIVSVNAATFAADETVLNTFVGGFAVADTAVNIQAHNAALQSDASHITSVTLSGSTVAAPEVLTLSATSVASDAALLAKIVSPYVLDATTATTSTLTGVGGGGMTFNIGNAGAGVATTITGGAGLDAFDFSAHFGTATLTDFGVYNGGYKADTISLSTTDFANWSTLVSDAKGSGSNTVFTAADGASLTLVGIPLHNVQNPSAALVNEIKFHA